MATNTTPVVEIETGALAAVTKAPPNDVANKRRADYFIALAKNMKIESAEDYELAAEELRAVKAFWKNLEDERVSLVGPLNAVVDKLNARFQPLLKALCGDGKKPPCENAEAIIKATMVAWQQKEAARIAEEQRVANERAEAERKRLAEEAAQREREAAEAAAAAQAAAAAGDHQAAAAAQEAAEQAQAQAAAAVHTAAVITAPPPAPVFRPTGISTVKTLDYEITDKAAFLKFALEQRPDLLDMWAPDAAKMRALIKLQGEATKMPGLRVFNKTGVAVR